MKPQIVMDTNVFIAGLRSSLEASFQLLSRIDGDQFDLNISVPLIFEYEDAAKSMSRSLGLTHSDIDDILEYICKVSNHHEIYFLWRPFLRDPKDDFVLELAVEGNCESIVAFNRRHFEGVESFGVEVETPQEFLVRIGAL